MTVWYIVADSSNGVI